MDIRAVRRMLRETDTASGAFPAIDPARQNDLYAELNRTPRVAAVSIKTAALRGFEKTMAESLLRMWAINLGPVDRIGRPVPSNRREGTDMRWHEIGDADGDRVKGLLPTRGPNPADRGFVNAVLHVVRTGVPWRDLPERFGNWNSVWCRFERWAEAGVWGRVLAAVRDPDVSVLVLDSTVVRAHPHAAGAKKSGRDRGQDEQVLCRSRGGFGTRHM